MPGPEIPGPEISGPEMPGPEMQKAPLVAGPFAIGQQDRRSDRDAQLVWAEPTTVLGSTLTPGPIEDDTAMRWT